MKYLCEPCNFVSYVKIGFDRHLKTKKHLEKVNEKTNNNPKHSQNIPKSISIPQSKHENVNKCCYCENIYATSANLTRHKKLCGEKIELINSYDNKIKELINAYDNKINELHNHYKNEIGKLKDTIKYMKKLCEKDKMMHENSEVYHQKIEDIRKEQTDNLQTQLNNSNVVVKTSVSALAYVVQNYTDAPRLTKLADYGITTYNKPKAIEHKQNTIDTEEELSENEIIEDTEEREEIEEKNKYNFITIVQCKYEKHTLHKYLGNIIIQNYKKTDPKQQSLWNSDTSRLTYLIRDLIQNNKIDWHVDKKGVMTKQLIINPLLDHVHILLEEYINSKLSTKTANQLSLMQKLNLLGKVLADIRNDTLGSDILRYIAPYFTLKKTNEENNNKKKDNNNENNAEDGSEGDNEGDEKY